ncbi:MAG: ABC transporter ATP-binding protein [Oscillospiraceae bacterium]|nr:ABC transporter ATP-binding protein [Oscillospiraceae bacterium]
MHAIEIQDLTKKFRIYADQGQSLKEKLLSKKRRKYEERTVLDGISLTVEPGEAIGLVGKNGSGKSTLLKLMSRILYPDGGSVKLNGRVSSLIELGAGFHPDMTGRENIFTNASIFGLTHKEIEARMDEIIEFSEMQEFIDNPVRTYSSGMYMRLAFSVAIHVGADILLIDEILAVGDAAFQAKCFERLMEIKAAGTTVVIVSHSMAQLERICDRTVWIDSGKIRMEGPPNEVHPAYLDFMGQRRQLSAPVKAAEQTEKADTPARWTDICLLNEQGERITQFRTGDTVTLQMTYEADPERAEAALIGLALYRADKALCYGTNTQRERMQPLKLKARGTVRCTFSPMNLIAGTYWFDVGLRRMDMFAYDYAAQAVRFTVYNTIDETGVARLAHQWQTDTD